MTEQPPGQSPVTGHDAPPPARASLWRMLGPGLITGAADDDPSGIATYSIAGAQFGMSLLWTAPLAWPLMAAVQYSCARIGMVTGRGLLAALAHRFPRPLLLAVCLALFLANTINIGADLAGMAEAAELLSGVSSHWWVIGFATLILWATVQLRYAQIARLLKWLALVLLAYVAAAIDIGPDWSAVIRATLVPRLPTDHAGWLTLVAILGTTISPYLFFWQASQEVEEEKGQGRSSRRSREGATADELLRRRVDVVVGTFFSVFTMFFIMLTTALTLHAHGLTQVTTSGEVAQALEPLAGARARLLYTAGIVGLGTLAIPTLAGSAAYAFAELFGWRQGIDQQWRRARAFYAVIAVSVIAGVVVDFTPIGAVRALFLTAVLNGLLSPLLLVAIAAVAADATIMRGQPVGWLGRSAVLLTALLMAAAAVVMVVG